MARTAEIIFSNEYWDWRKLASGAVAQVGHNGKVVEIFIGDDIERLNDYFIDESSRVCECEQDWNCPLHANRAGTWLETRYDGADDYEAHLMGW